MGAGLRLWPELRFMRMVNGLGLALGLWPELRLRVMV